MAFEGVFGPVVYHTSYWASFWTAMLGWSFRGAGRDNLPRTGPVILAANHQSLIDPILVGLVAKRPLTYLAKSELFSNRLFGKFISYYGARPIERTMGKEGLNAVFNALNRQEAVLIFPEGERTLSGKVLEMKPGISLIIRRADAMVVPVGIAGAYESWPRGQILPNPSPLFLPGQQGGIACVYGPPVSTAELKSLGREEMLNDLSQRIQDVQQQAEQLRRK